MRLNLKIAAIPQESKGRPDKWARLVIKMEQVLKAVKDLPLEEKDIAPLAALLSEMQSIVSQGADTSFIDLEHQTLINFVEKFKIRKDEYLTEKHNFICYAQDITSLGLAALKRRQNEKKEAAAQIKELDLDYRTVSWANEVGKMFWPAFEIIEIQQYSSEAEQKRVSEQLRRMLHALIYGDKFVLSSGPLPQADAFTVESAAILAAMVQVETDPEVAVSRQYLQIITRILGLKLGLPLFDVFLATGPEGEQLDSEIEKSDITIQEGIKALLDKIRKTPKTDATEEEKQRVRAAERRVGACVRYLNTERVLVGKHRDNLCKFFQEKKEELSDACTVGWDFRLISLEDEVRLILGHCDTNSVGIAELKKQQCEWLKRRIGTVLQGHGIVEPFTNDVHALNTVIQWCLPPQILGSRFEPLIDPYGSGIRDILHEKKQKIMQDLLRADYLIADTQQESDLNKHIDKTVKVGHLCASYSYGGSHLNESSAFNVLKALLGLEDHIWQKWLIDERPEGDECFKTLDSIMKVSGWVHGILGVIASLGKVDLFKDVQLKLSNADKKDKTGKRLIDHAIESGSIELLAQLKVDKEDLWKNIQAYTQNKLPNAIGMAAQSGNTTMLDLVIDAIPEAQQWRYLTEKTSEGTVPLIMALSHVALLKGLLVYLKKRAPTPEAYSEHLRDAEVLVKSAELNKINAIEILVSAGVSLQHKEWRRPIQIASQKGHLAFIRSSFEQIKKRNEYAYIQIFFETSHDLARYAGIILEEELRTASTAEIYLMLSRAGTGGDLAKYNGIAFENIIKRIKEPAEQLNILKIKTYVEGTLAHDMAQYKGAILANWLKPYTLKKKLEILAMRGDRSRTVLMTLMRANKYQAIAILLSCQSVSEKMDLLNIKDGSQTIVSLLKEEPSFDLLEFLTEKQDEASLRNLVSQVSDFDGFIQWVAWYDIKSLDIILQYCPISETQKLDVLSTVGPNGKCHAWHFMEKYPERFRVFLSSLSTLSAVIEVLSIQHEERYLTEALPNELSMIPVLLKMTGTFDEKATVLKLGRTQSVFARMGVPRTPEELEAFNWLCKWILEEAPKNQNRLLITAANLNWLLHDKMADAIEREREAIQEREQRGAKKHKH